MLPTSYTHRCAACFRCAAKDLLKKFCFERLANLAPTSRRNQRITSARLEECLQAVRGVLGERGKTRTRKQGSSARVLFRECFAQDFVGEVAFILVLA